MPLSPLLRELWLLTTQAHSEWRRILFNSSEVNTDDLIMYKNRGIANPLPTIQAVVVLAITEAFGKRVIYSTYQAVSGAGMGGVQDLEAPCRAYIQIYVPIASNCMPQIDVFLDSGYTRRSRS